MYHIKFIEAKIHENEACTCFTRLWTRPRPKPMRPRPQNLLASRN